MSFPWNITNPGILLTGLLTSEEKQFVVDLFELSYADGDILYYNSGLQRLPKGTDGQFLKLVSGLPAWAAGGGGGGGYTTLAEFIDETPWRIFYSNGSGDVTALSFGTSGQYLKSNGASSAPSWDTITTNPGTVTSVSVVSANGFAGTVATATSTPAITLTTTVTGLLKGNGTSISAATASDIISAYYFVAANDATTKEKALADYQCDGTADEVQINAALDLIRATGGMVRLSSGNFAIAASINMLGNVAEADDNPFMQLLGAGSEATILTGGSNINVIATGQRAKYEIAYFTAVASGSGDCISQTAGTERGNWQSWIHDVYLQGNFTNHTGWGLDMQSPFRMRFENIEMNGVANGARFVAHTDAFNPGNLTVDRMFIDLWNDVSNASAIGFQLKVNSTTSTNVMNLVSVNRLDIAGGTNLTSSIGIHIVGATASYGDSRHHTFTNLNIEDIKTIIKMERGRDCSFNDLNYCRPLSGGTIIELDSSSHNNSFENLYAVAQGASQTFNLIVDNNGSSNLPNSLRRVDGFQPATVTINATLATNTILEQIDLSGGSPTIDSDITNRNNTRTFQDVLVTDEAYGVGWNGSLEVPTKNAIYDKIETLGGVTKVGTPANNQVGVWTGDGTIEGTSTFTHDSATGDTSISNTTTGAAGPILELYHDSASPAANDIVGVLKFFGEDSAGNKQEYAAINTEILSTTSTSETAQINFRTISGGSLVDRLTLGSASLRPGVADGLSLGTSSSTFSDLFLAEGGVINWDNGDATITQAGDVLTVSGADLRVTTAGTDSDSVLTSGGSQIVYNKSLVLPSIKPGNYPTNTGSVQLLMTNSNSAYTVGFPRPTDGDTTGLSTDANVAYTATTQTFTNKRITPRRGTTTSSATPTINTDNVDIYSLTAQAVDITSFTTNLSGTPTHGQNLIIEITGTAARAITWGSSFESSTVTLPTTTVTTNMLTVGFKWNSTTSKWRCIAVA